MYAYLEGRLIEKGATNLVLAVGGTGYEIAVPLGSQFTATAGEEVRVWTHLAVREDAHRLYGFADRETRDLFRLLLVVRGVGPALALGILSSLSQRECLEAIAAGDAKRLQTIRGVGRKTAEQVVLDLQERAGTFLDGAPQAGVLIPQPQSAVQEDAIAALLSIGFSERDAKKSVLRAAEKVGTDDLEVLVRTALQP